jgi:transposase InsO family protein
MRRGFLYLVAIMDWASRKVLVWRLSNTMDTEFCIEALEEAFGKHGRPEIFNTDQGSQFTSPRFTRILKEAGVRISMDGKGRWMDNVFTHRFLLCAAPAFGARRADARRGLRGRCTHVATGGLTATGPSLFPPPAVRRMGATSDHRKATG